MLVFESIKIWPWRDLMVLLKLESFKMILLKVIGHVVAAALRIRVQQL